MSNDIDEYVAELRRLRRRIDGSDISYGPPDLVELGWLSERAALLQWKLDEWFYEARRKLEVPNE